MKLESEMEQELATEQESAMKFVVVLVLEAFENFPPSQLTESNRDHKVNEGRLCCSVEA